MKKLLIALTLMSSSVFANTEVYGNWKVQKFYNEYHDVTKLGATQYADNARVTLECNIFGEVSLYLNTSEYHHSRREHSAEIAIDKKFFTEIKANQVKKVVYFRNISQHQDLLEAMKRGYKMRVVSYTFDWEVVYTYIDLSGFTKSYNLVSAGC